MPRLVDGVRSPRVRALHLAPLLVAACGASPQPVSQARWADATLAKGQQIFAAVCAGCHGTDGRARSVVAQALFPRPRDLVDGQYRFRSTASGTLPLREDLLRTLRYGLPGTQMPSWRSQLSTQELMSVVLWVQSLSPRFRNEDYLAEEDDILVPASPTAAPAATPATIARGKKLYEELKCADCHGALGRGDGPSAPTLENQDGSRSHVFDFSYGVYKAGDAPIDVYRTFVTGLDGTPMPSYHDSIPEPGDRWALVHYCLSLSRERGLWFYLSERPTWNEPQRADRGVERRVEAADPDEP